MSNRIWGASAEEEKEGKKGRMHRNRMACRRMVVGGTLTERVLECSAGDLNQKKTVGVGFYPGDLPGSLDGATWR
jgi:hypothetical protein